MATQQKRLYITRSPKRVEQPPQGVDPAIVSSIVALPVVLEPPPVISPEEQAERDYGVLRATPPIAEPVPPRHRGPRRLASPRCR